MATKKKAKKAAKRSPKKAKAAPAKKGRKRALAAKPKAARSAARKAPKKAKAAPRRAKAKPAAKRPAAPARAAARAKPIQRRDRPGHLDPQYAADLLERAGEHPADPSSFLDRPRSKDDLSEELGEEFVKEATSAEHEGEDLLNQEVPEERGGPFVETTAAQEFAPGTDPSNPKSASREPFPKT